MKGTIVESHTGTETGEGNPHSFKIQGDDEKIYFAHLGDLQDNEDKVYRENTVVLRAGDPVEFKPLEPSLRAASVKKT